MSDGDFGGVRNWERVFPISIRTVHLEGPVLLYTTEPFLPITSGLFRFSSEVAVYKATPPNCTLSTRRSKRTVPSKDTRVCDMVLLLENISKSCWDSPHGVLEANLEETIDHGQRLLDFMCTRSSAEPHTVSLGQCW
jgi:hypothetical protein